VKEEEERREQPLLLFSFQNAMSKVQPPELKKLMDKKLSGACLIKGKRSVERGSEERESEGCKGRRKAAAKGDLNLSLSRPAFLGFFVLAALSSVLSNVS